jgi:hypothetical protein
MTSGRSRWFRALGGNLFFRLRRPVFFFFFAAEVFVDYLPTCRRQLVGWQRFANRR